MYTIISKSDNCFDLRFDPFHQIYKAHFPNNPITPGVCLMQIVGDLASDLAGRKLRMVGAKNVKFLATLVPEASSVVTFQLVIKQTEPFLEVQSVVQNEEAVICKMTTIYE